MAKLKRIADQLRCNLLKSSIKNIRTGLRAITSEVVIVEALVAELTDTPQPKKRGKK